MTARVIGNFSASRNNLEEEKEGEQTEASVKKKKKGNRAYAEYLKTMAEIEERKNSKTATGRIIGCIRDPRAVENKEFLEKKKRGLILTSTIGDLIKFKEQENQENA